MSSVLLAYTYLLLSTDAWWQILPLLSTSSIGLPPLNSKNFFKFSPARFNTRGHHLRLIIPFIQTNTHKFYFLSGVVLLWNALPEDVVSAPSTISFKKRLLKIDLTKFLQFPCILWAQTYFSILYVYNFSIIYHYYACILRWSKILK